jgi:cytochrome P450
MLRGMTIDGVAGERDGAAGERDSPAVVFVGPFAGGLAEACAAYGWRVCSVDAPLSLAGASRGGDEAATADRIAAFLARPDSPHRAVLIGGGAASYLVADRHPERVTGVVVLEAAGGPEPDCPTLVVAGADPRAEVLRFVAGLTGGAASCPVRPPVLEPALLGDPEVIRQLREAAPVHRIGVIGAGPAWLLTGHEVSTAVLGDPRVQGRWEMTAGFRLRPDGAGTVHRGERDLVTIDAGEHARLRRLVATHLTPRRVGDLRPRIQAETDRLLDAIPAGEVVDLVSAFARPLPIIVLCELVGIPAADRAYFADWLVRRMTAQPPDPHADVDRYLGELIGARRARPSDDLISAVLAAEGERLDEAELISAIRLLMVGGHRAPTTLLASGVAALLGEGAGWSRLVADPTLLDSAVEELLRTVSPFPVGLARYTAAPIPVGDRTIPADCLVAASLVAANRDPARFAEPERFDITRTVNPHLAFGHGHHYCPGAALARAEAGIALGSLVRRFPGLRLAGHREALRYRRGRVRYLLELPVVARPAPRNGVPA